jgi:S-adenosylmethionine:tRNA ribosyltransferase-isomerase
MSPARAPRRTPLEERLLVVDPRREAHEDARVRDLPRYLKPGDLVVVNDAATIPASFRGRTVRGEAAEVRLGGEQEDGTWTAVLFGAGDWRTRTEHRPEPPPVRAGEDLEVGEGLRARVESISTLSPRLVALRFDCSVDALWPALYRSGRPVQYAHLSAPLELWDVQTPYTSRPWAVELPSAGRPLAWEVLLGLRRRGVGLATVTHAAGLSATGDPRIDDRLPLPERYEVPRATGEAILAAKRAGGRVLAVGTTVVRALEGCAAAHGGALAAGRGVTDLVIDPRFRLRVADGLLTGLHDRSASHFSLLQAFAPPAVLEAAYAHADGAGYLDHEFGDSNLILRDALDQRDASGTPASATASTV